MPSISQLPWQIHASSAKQQQIALRDHSQGVAFSWQQLNQYIAEKVDFLRQQGLSAGCGVALSGKNSLDLLCYYLAALQLNLSVLGLNPAFTQEKIVELCQANRIQCWINGSQQFSLTQWQSEKCFPQPMTLTLTSGSTGMPKAIAHNIEAHLANAAGVCALMNFTPAHSWLLSLPLYHVSGQGIVWRWLLQGAELHLPSADFYADVLQATHVSLVPTQGLRLLNYMAEQPKSAVKTQAILLGGAHIPTELTEKLTVLGMQAYSGYGMTEMASTAFAKKCDGKPGVGQPLLGREFRLVNDEIWLRGAGLGLGYWQQGKLQPLTNAQGWLQTKDKGVWLAEQEQLQILGRLDNLFISGGENIQPEDIEQVILQHHSVEQVFVLPMEDQEFGHRPVAMIKFKQDFEQSFEQSAVENLRVWLADKIERFKQPVYYFPLITEQQGNIKISRTVLKQHLKQLIKKV
ncbi:o-succinylbenzoate--CoA ligase [Pasteurellaceae bacterium Pebbles2]|nr:o-succinylbenzoate--CoA ligase [Pasteurellaceae bacterium Pebbles2]